MRVAVVSSYPPRHCGIGSYAHGQVERLRSEGDDVTVISPPDGDGDVRVGFDSGRVFREVARRDDRWDRIVVHFQPGIYYRPGAAAAISKVRTSLGLLGLVRRRPGVEVLVHEAHRPTRWRPDHVLLRRALGRATLSFHTDAERVAFERDYRLRVPPRLADHRDGVAVRDPIGRDEARRRLGLEITGPLFVCVGFLHPWKGYERAVRAFAASTGPGRLAIVGSVRHGSAENLAYAERLRRLVEATDGVDLVETYLSDEDFDAWIIAADRLVLPYTRAWSSGALAHAAVLGTPAIVSAVGGLAEQAGPEDTVVRSDDELVAAFQRLRDAAVPSPGEVDARP
jgi:glycosyltransferase involved in cell wall biosynthesis